MGGATASADIIPRLNILPTANVKKRVLWLVQAVKIRKNFLCSALYHETGLQSEYLVVKMKLKLGIY